jgi:branched-subunit amino acid transport protein
VTALWITIVAVALASAAIRAFGPILVGGRELPQSANAIIAQLAPALLAALVVTQTFGEDGRLVLDEKAIGVAIAAVALALRAPVLLAVALAVVATALARTFG